MSEKYWNGWKASVRSTMKADLQKSQLLVANSKIGEVLGRVENRHKEALDDLRAELAALRTEVSQLRAETKLCGALDDVQARLAKLETPPRLKAAG